MIVCFRSESQATLKTYIIAAFYRFYEWYFAVFSGIPPMSISLSIVFSDIFSLYLDFPMIPWLFSGNLYTLP